MVQKQGRLRELTKSVAPLFKEETTLAEIEEGLRILQQEIQAGEAQLQQLQEQEQRTRLQIQQMQADGTLDSLYQQISQQQALVENLTTDYALAKLENQLLQDIATELSEQQLPELLKQATSYFQELTNNAHSRLDFSEGLLTVDQMSIYNLSTGTKDQVMMAFRFAYLALQQKHPLCPVIIDDGWLHYDHQRKYQFAKLLQHFSENYQVICLSSDQEMVSYYQELHQPVWELKESNDEKIKELTVDEQFEMYVLIKNADVRLAKNGKNLSRLLSKILLERWMANFGMLLRKRLSDTRPDKWFY